MDGLFNPLSLHMASEGGEGCCLFGSSFLASSHCMFGGAYLKMEPPGFPNGMAGLKLSSRAVAGQIWISIMSHFN